MRHLHARRVFLSIAIVLAGFVSAMHAQTQFFEDPRALVTGGARFPTLLAVDNSLAIVYQESISTGDERGQLFISVTASPDGREWVDYPRRIGPVDWAGGVEPYVFSATAGPDGSLWVAVTASAERTEVYRSDGAANEFALVHTVSTGQTNVAPHLYAAPSGTVLLFANANVNGRQQIVVTRTGDGGSTWSELAPLEDNSEIGLTFLPTIAAREGRVYVVFQGLNLLERTTNQLYVKVSDDDGITWSPAQRFTTFGDPTVADDVDEFDNQRPDLAVAPDGALFIAWERRVQTGGTQIYLAEMEEDGSFGGAVEEVSGRFDLARAPRLTFDGNEPVLTWFTNPRGNSRITIGRRGGFRWATTTVSPAVGEATFAEALPFGERLHVVWQRRAADGSEIVYLEPDQSVAVPTLNAATFRASQRGSAETIRVNVVDPPDASGIRGYAYTWSRDPQAEVPREVMQRVPERSIVVSATEDGPWYLRVRAADFAENWSAPQTISYILDTTPPGPISFPPPSLDEQGFVGSNTFTLQWDPPDGDDPLRGYAVRFELLSGNPALPLPIAFSREPAPAVAVTEPAFSGVNIPDGLWVLSVAAVDSVGNVGPARSLPLRFNKFAPVTRVFGTDVSRDVAGGIRLAVSGRGFESNGTVSQIALDLDGREPFDFEYNDWQNSFRVVDDRLIEGISVTDVPPGRYRLVIRHPDRGIYVAPQPVIVDAFGVIKYGDFSPQFAAAYEGAPVDGTLRTSDIVFWLVVGAAILLALVSAIRLIVIANEIQRLGNEARALVGGGAGYDLDTGKVRRMKTQGLGLRIKFAFFVVLLVVAVVVLVAVVLGRNVLQRQENILVRGLEQRIALLVEGQVTGARPALQNPQLNLDQLQTLSNQGEAMDEALYVTITGLDGQSRRQTLYGTTDPRIIQAGGASESGASLLDTDSYVVGVSRLDDEISPTVEELAEEINAQAAAELGDIPIQLAELAREAQQLILSGAPDSEIARIDQVRTELLRQGRERLDELAGPIRSEPPFDFARLRRDITEYLFFKPVTDILPGAGAEFRDYYRGTVRVSISTQAILDEIDQTTRDLVITTLAIAALAVGLGVLGAYILATIVVRPINRLVTLVEMIAATEDKSQLKGRDLDLKTRDELSVLARSINTMMAGLAKAAEADKDLKFGKETQKAFIPLEPITDDTKRTFGEVIEPSVYFFGYYEGAKGVSGDYFTHQKLSDRYYAMIKCDVAGKGIPAALIMVQVATVFQDYFRGWTTKSPGLELSSLVLRINDIVAERQFKGRFAALTAGILDAQTGKFYLANAGDNQLHLFRQSLGAVEQLTLPGGPAAGTFSSNDLPVSFPQEVLKIETGDLILFFTDGLEEAKRLLRGPDFKPFVVTKEMVEAGELEEGIQVDEDGEEFTITRIHDIIGQVETGGTYRLTKKMNPIPNEELVFDYSGSENRARDSVLAIVAAERIFRLVPDPQAGPSSRISIDRIIVEFLERHFLQFSRYFSHRVTVDEPDKPKSQYIEFSHIREDEQFDDITMLIVERT